MSDVHSFMDEAVRTLVTAAPVDVNDVARGKRNILHSEEMKSQIIQANSNAYQAIGSKDASTEEMYRTVPPHLVLPSSTPLPLTVNIEKLLAKAPKGSCTRTRVGAMHCDAAVQTDPYDASIAEVEQLRSALALLHSHVTAQTSEITRLRYAAQNSVSRHYLDSACALTPSHASVDAAVSVARETLAQALMMRITRREAVDMLREKAERDSVTAALGKAEQLQRVAQAAALQLAQERQDRLEASRKAAESRVDAFSRAQLALQEAEERRRRRERDKDAAILALGEDSDSSDDDGLLSPSPPPILSPRSPPPQPLTPSLPLAAPAQPLKSALRPFAGGLGAGDEALLRRVQRLEEALAVWETAAQGGDLLAAVERAVDAVASRSLAHELRAVIDACAAEAQRLTAHAEGVEAHVREQELTLNHTTVTQLLRRMDELERQGEGDEGSARGAYIRLARQHRETAAQMRQIKEMLAASARARQPRPPPSTKAVNAAASASLALPGAVGTGLGGSMRDTRGARAPSAAIGATVQASELLLADARVETQDRMQALTRTLLALQARQDAHASRVSSTVQELDRAIGVLSDMLHRGHLGLATGFLHTETEKALLRRAAAVEGGVAGVLHGGMTAALRDAPVSSSSFLPTPATARPRRPASRSAASAPTDSILGAVPRAATASLPSRHPTRATASAGFSGYPVPPHHHTRAGPRATLGSSGRGSAHGLGRGYGSSPPLQGSSGSGDGGGGGGGEE